MSNEDVQKKMEFIIEQLADLTVKQQQTDSVVNRLANASLDRIERIERVLGALAEAQVKTEANVSALTAAQMHTDKKLVETDERLSSLITVVERYISEGRNGNAHG
jgi:ABC-type transporter Mla subunit MlaD